MGKRITILVLGVSVLLTFTACGRKTEVTNTEGTEVSESLKETELFSEMNTVEETESVPETHAIIETSETDTEEVTVSVLEPVETEDDKTSDTEDSSVNKDYLSIVEAEDDGSSFALRYINGDDTPELVVVDSRGDMSIYTMKADSVVCLVDSMYSVEWTYFEKKSIICCFARWNGGGDEGGYGRFYYHLTEENGTFTYESPTTFKNVYNAVYDENGEYTGNGIENYYYRDEEIEEAAYQQIFSDLGIVEYEDELLIASLSKDEVIEELIGRTE